ncbi:LD31742p [Strongyloides ratti]|uniref:LD31742p n=1 Tax=Strongyloides ratti TaxID=34506 RepID=A0A090MVB2_STRRB|nr:LD31742p [Strongyloides ratti]CEF62783.1 LD31742p [Strongyloides ratti]
MGKNLKELSGEGKFIPTNQYDIKKIKRKLELYEITLRNKCFPLKPEWLISFIFFNIILNYFGMAPFNNFINNLSTKIGDILNIEWPIRLGIILTIGFILSTIFVLFSRILFSILLYYHGWMYEEIGKKPSIQTKIFFVIIQFVYSYATFLSYEKCMPRMPIPKVKNTIKQYLKTVRPIMDDNEYNDIVNLADDFEKNVAPGLQIKLWLKWLSSPNYISDWWKEIVYMRYRGSLIKTNVASGDVIYQKTTNIQAARAANVTLIRLQFGKDTIQKQSMLPMTLGGVPLCPVQYKDQHRSIRLPGEESDVMHRLIDTKFIAVYYKGVWYKINIFYGNRLLRPAELEKAIQKIIDNPKKSNPFEDKISSLTAGERDLWAKIRKEKFNKGINKESLFIIENALEIIFLDDQDWEYDPLKPETYSKECAKALTGDGVMLWCDRVSVQYYSKNGRQAGNAEHSVVDAMIYVHIREYIKYHEEFISTYTEDGHCKGEIEFVPNVEHLKWELDDELINAIKTSYTFAKNVADDFINSYVIFNNYGKNFVKKANVSPDAFIQMALQMAYYKDQGKFELTYEPAVMRLFKEGRTETIRSCSIESCNFVRSMLDKNIDDKEKFSLLKISCDGHQKYFRDAMTGKGVDRHLFGMYVVSKYYNIQHKFLDKVFSMNYALSTSQTPQHQMAEYSKKLNADPKLFWPAGGFCCPDGSNYGVCYTVGASGDCFSFHVTGWRSQKHTDVHRFMKYIIESMGELKTMVENAIKN